MVRHCNWLLIDCSGDRESQRWLGPSCPRELQEAKWLQSPSQATGQPWVFHVKRQHDALGISGCGSFISGFSGIQVTHDPFFLHKISPDPLTTGPTPEHQPNRDRRKAGPPTSVCALDQFFHSEALVHGQTNVRQP